MVAAIVANVIFLGAFKFYNFGVDSLLQLFNLLQIPSDIRVLRILIPVGISFYTFRVISHLVDCRRGVVPIPTLVDYANYVAFFPQIMSGPIVRAKDFYKHLDAPTLFSYSQGRILTLVLSGLFKKYVLASFLYDAATQPFSSPANFSSLDLATGMLAYAAMIFVDFSGYSDLAIAISNLLGFHVHRNFNNPYRAIGLKDFWNRWHISLSAWLRDYVYIPLGGSRKGTARKYLNILITMFVSGLWHGAGLNFVVWGLLHGVGSVVSHLISERGESDEKRVMSRRRTSVLGLDDGEIDFFGPSSNKNAAGLFVDLSDEELDSVVDDLFRKLEPDESIQELPRKTPLAIAASCFGWLVTFVYVACAWVFFTAPSLNAALGFFSALVTSTVVENKILNARTVAVAVFIVAFNFVGHRAFKGSIELLDRIPFVVRVPVAAAGCYAIIHLGPETMPPFVYFSF